MDPLLGLAERDFDGERVPVGGAVPETFVGRAAHVELTQRRTQRGLDGTAGLFEHRHQVQELVVGQHRHVERQHRPTERHRRPGHTIPHAMDRTGQLRYFGHTRVEHVFESADGV